MTGTLALVLGVVLAAAAAGLAVHSLASTFLVRRDDLDSALSPYVDGPVPAPVDDSADAGDGSLATTTIVRRAVEVTAQLADQRGLLVKAEAALERADLPLRAAEALFFHGAVVALALVASATLTGSIMGVLVVTGAVAALPPAVIAVLATRRRRAFEGLLPDTLQLLASTLRAGFSLMQGVEAVSHEISEPMGRELRRVVTEARLGRPLEEALDGVGERMGSADFDWAVMAIRIQREVGGNLAELLVTVAGTMTERERLRRDVRSLTAEGRVSAVVLGIMPPALGAVVYSMNPTYLEPLFTDGLGQTMLGGSIVMALFGFWWMKKMIQVDV